MAKDSHDDFQAAKMFKQFAQHAENHPGAIKKEIDSVIGQFIADALALLYMKRNFEAAKAVKPELIEEAVLSLTEKLKRRPGHNGDMEEGIELLRKCNITAQNLRDKTHDQLLNDSPYFQEGAKEAAKKLQHLLPPGTLPPEPVDPWIKRTLKIEKPQRFRDQ